MSLVTLSCFLSGKARWKIFLKSSAWIFPSGYFCVSSVKYLGKNVINPLTSVTSPPCKIFIKRRRFVFTVPHLHHLIIRVITHSVTICMLRRAVLLAMYWKSLALSLLLACVLPILITRGNIQDKSRCNNIQIEYRIHAWCYLEIRLIMIFGETNPINTLLQVPGYSLCAC